jgi:branched-chain amino acid transport system permease protein
VVKTRLKKWCIYTLGGASFFLPIIYPNIHYLDIGIHMGIYFIVTMGLAVLLGYAGQISIGQAAFFGIGAYASGLLSSKCGMNFWISAPFAVIFTGLVGYIVGLTSVRLRHGYLAMATVAFQVIFGVLVFEWIELTGGPAGLGGVPSPSIGVFKIDTETGYFYFVWVIAFLAFLFIKNVVSGRIKRVLISLKEDEIAASSIGIYVPRYKLKVFTLSAIYAGIGGVLFTHYARFISPSSFSFNFSFTFLVMVLIGGIGSIWGAFFGSIFLTLLPEVLRFLSTFSLLPLALRNILSNYTYNLIFYGLLVYLFVAFLPRGIYGLGLTFLVKYSDTLGVKLERG